MCSERTKYKCRFHGCGETFKTTEGRRHHEEVRHRTWITPTIGTEKQLFDVSHFCTWNRSTRYQLDVELDRLNVDSCF